MANTPFFDWHTHNQNAPDGQAIINIPQRFLCHPDEFQPRADTLYSVGIHPWWLGDDNSRMWYNLLRLLELHPQIVAIGETGLDRLRPYPQNAETLSIQKTWFKRHALIAEERSLPLIIHCVRAYDVLLAVYKEIQPRSRWIVHGFRGKPALANQLLDAGMQLSFGERANPDTVALVPANQRLYETDESPLSIQDVVARYREV